MESEVLDKGEQPVQGYVRIPLPILEIVIGLIVLAILSWYVVQAYLLPKPFNSHDIGAGGFPLLVAFGTGIATISMIGLAVARLMGKMGRSDSRWRRPLFVLIVALLLVGQAVSFETLGVYLCVALFSAAIMVAAGERRILHVLGVPIGLVAFIYVVFALALNVVFP
ncbi:hypothetical protein SJ05684_b43580 (plasmid) [Sinorhizobium sojae CCBAU 05684]|uniref:DUF1468 domain-containing protein n=1 Tax=Sinorhizobium sojae CCBAU 05684 TaxID=716928 RepID=A0A249PHC4_9HYPH|nr:tripartite tricarboxylate transporter TctB family protein [Sinorhizobium sojae]ASY65340.1 hypothetical protein SJ05684_b43580 [Sinorhizobium sojae CCBAU 05684]